jgi:hypothetical protein
VVLNGADADTKAEVTLEAPLTLDTQDLEIGPYATLTLGTNALTNGGTGTVTNNGTIKTTAATKDDVEDILAFHGIIEIDDLTVGGASSETLTVPSTTTLTVPSWKTLTLGDGDGGATLILTAATSQLVLGGANATLNAANEDSTIVGTSSTTRRM